MISREVKIAAGVVALAIAGTFIFYFTPRPDIRSVNGVYSSDRCGNLIIQDGVVAYAGRNARMTLIFERKFGLVGELDRPLGPFFVPTVNGKKEPLWLSFDKDTVTAERYAHEECVFTRRK